MYLDAQQGGEAARCWLARAATGFLLQVYAPRPTRALGLFGGGGIRESVGRGHATVCRFPAEPFSLNIRKRVSCQQGCSPIRLCVRDNSSCLRDMPPGHLLIRPKIVRLAHASSSLFVQCVDALALHIKEDYCITIDFFAFRLRLLFIALPLDHEQVLTVSCSRGSCFELECRAAWTGLRESE